jgi:predicted amidophosphoribosyltransferase
MAVVCQYCGTTENVSPVLEICWQCSDKLFNTESLCTYCGATINPDDNGCCWDCAFLMEEGEQHGE